MGLKMLEKRRAILVRLPSVQNRHFYAGAADRLTRSQKVGKGKSSRRSARFHRVLCSCGNGISSRREKTEVLAGAVRTVRVLLQCVCKSPLLPLNIIASTILLCPVLCMNSIFYLSTLLSSVPATSSAGVYDRQKSVLEISHPHGTLP